VIVKDQARIRLQIIEARYGEARSGRPPSAEDLAADRARRFCDGFRRVREGVLVPILEDIGSALVASGHGHRVDLDVGERLPSLEWHLLLRSARAGATNVIRMFPRPGQDLGWEIIAEVQLDRTLVELTRFKEIDELTPEVAEQMIVDAVEQVFACNAGR
jgi:hypothetical protein